ncbi:MAG: hypothetical protein ACSLEX_03050 [Minisyncoccota bacterium]
MLIVCNIENLIQAISNIVTVLATIAGIFLAIKGFSTWKDQLRGKTDYELARRYLRAIYKVRDAIKFVRNPFIPVEEMGVALKQSGKTQEDDSRETTRMVYNLRWKKVNEAESDLRVELLEAEVSWGQEALDVEKDFHACVIKIYVALKMYLDFDNSSERRKEDKELIYDQGENDKFNKELDSAIKKIEKYLAPHLK